MLNKAQSLFFLFQFLVLSMLAAPLEARLAPKTQPFESSYFPSPPGLKAQVDFWKKVYSEYTTNQAIVHDSKRPNIIYEVLNLGANIPERIKERKRSQIKHKYRRILRSLARGNKTNLTWDERRVKELVKNKFNQAARNVRVQIGQKDRFREGLVRSGQYMDQIKKIFKRHGLPEALTVLPHVESSFQLNAYSHAGAAGIWQFTRRTGKRFLQIAYEVDERMAPLLATEAAAKLLKKNFEVLGSWPLAITAYNHGLQGMKRAKRRHGSDIVRIIKNYRSRIFGFASQNFYAEFLAALEVTRGHERYFPNLKPAQPLKTASIVLREHLSLDTAMRYFDMTKDEIVKYNHSLRRPVLSGEMRIPKGFIFKASAEKIDLQERYDQIPHSLRFQEQVASKWYTVRRGDTLSRIAARFGVSIRSLKQHNRVGRRNRIFAGQVLKLPRGRRGAPSYKQPVKVEWATIRDVAETGLYKVRKNDNLSVIARRYKTNPMVLATLNRMRDPNALYPGQWLRVPQKPTSSNAPSVRVIKKVDHILIEGKAEPRPVPIAKIQLVDHAFDSEYNLKNRPAFQPVVFTSAKNKDSRIGTITVDLDETLSHYADWAQLPLRKLRKQNNLRKGKTIKLHQKIKVPFNRITPEQFEHKRQEFHRAVQEDFFNNFRVYKQMIRKIKRGETLWKLSNEIYFIPFWLLSLYNPDQDIYSLAAGDTIVIPLIMPQESKAS